MRLNYTYAGAWRPRAANGAAVRTVTFYIYVMYNAIDKERCVARVHQYQCGREFMSFSLLRQIEKYPKKSHEAQYSSHLCAFKLLLTLAKSVLARVCARDALSYEMM